VSRPAGESSGPIDAAERPLSARRAPGSSAPARISGRESFDKNSPGLDEDVPRLRQKPELVSILHVEDWSIMAEAQERLRTENGGSGGTCITSHRCADVAEVLAVTRHGDC